MSIVVLHFLYIVAVTVEAMTAAIAAGGVAWTG